MTTHHLQAQSVSAGVPTVGSPELDTRYSMFQQFLSGAAIFAYRARAIEKMPADKLTSEIRAEHMALVTAAIIQSVAAIETESHELCEYGPLSDSLAPEAEGIDKLAVLKRFDKIFAIIGQPLLSKDLVVYMHADLLVKLRNELTHYKSRLQVKPRITSKDERFECISKIKRLGHSPPSFYPAPCQFFPHQCLGADCADWAIRTTVNFLDSVYTQLGISSAKLDSIRKRIAV